MPHISFRNVCIQHGSQWLLDHASFVIDAKERIAVLGRNGVGKSTLLKLIADQLVPDSGQIECPAQLTVAAMAQDVPQNIAGRLFDYIKRHQKDGDIGNDYQIDKVLSQLDVDPDLLLEHASGGQIRRALLAVALVNDPDVLLLDEPTNHLDIETIVWLERFLLQYPKTVVFVTHDRDFMRRVATRIIEIDLGHVTSWQGNYAGFLAHKASQLAAEQRMQSNFDKKLSKEEAWIRQGIKARRTRNEGRVRALKKMREQHALRRQRQGQVKLSLDDVKMAGKIVFELQHVGLAYDHKALVKDLSLTVMRGDKVAIIGPNGCGKSSLIRVMLGQQQPSQGHVRHGTKMQLVYFDQCREQLDLDATVIDNVAQGSDMVESGGVKKHVISYLQDFLFTPEKARSLVKTLSGGERNRLLLARILAKPSNVLVLDEPTNDLDMETLEMLDEFLLNYAGTILLISHDRALLNHVATQTIAFEGDGVWQNYVGGYDDYVRQHAALHSPQHTVSDINASPKKPSKASYEERKELAKLPKVIEKKENNIASLQQQMSQPGFYLQPAEDVAKLGVALEALEASLQQSYDRWEYLEQKYAS